MSVQVTDNMAKVLKSLNAMTSKVVLVGIPDSTAGRKEKGDAMNNATLGYIHENGSPKANIPARPFLGPGIKDAQPQIIERLERATRASLTGNVAEVDRQLNAAGLIAQNSVRAKINSGIPPALEESTLAARRRRGRTGDKPLIDTGQLRNSITYVVRKK